MGGVVHPIGYDEQRFLRNTKGIDAASISGGVFKLRRGLHERRKGTTGSFFSKCEDYLVAQIDGL